MTNMIETLRTCVKRNAAWVYPKYQLSMSEEEKHLLVEIAFSPIHTVGNDIVISRRIEKLTEMPTLYSFMKDLSICTMADTVGYMDSSMSELHTLISQYIPMPTDKDDQSIVYLLLVVAILGMDIYGIINATHPASIKRGK